MHSCEVVAHGQEHALRKVSFVCRSDASKGAVGEGDQVTSPVRYRRDIAGETIGKAAHVASPSLGEERAS